MTSDDFNSSSQGDSAAIENLTKRQLLAIAREHGVRGRSRMTRAELVSAVSAIDPPVKIEASQPKAPPDQPIGPDGADQVVAPEPDPLGDPDLEIPLRLHPIVVDPQTPAPPVVDGAASDDALDAAMADHVDPPPVAGSTEEPTKPTKPPKRRRGLTAVTIGSLYDIDDRPMPLPGTWVLAAVIFYVIINRLISDRFVLPFGVSIRLYEVILMGIGLLWLLWMATEPLPLPYGLPAISGLVLITLIAIAPFIHWPGLDSFQRNGAERGLFRMFVFVTLFLAAYHLAFRLRTGLILLGVIVAATVGQALFAIYELVTERPVTFLDSIATSIGLIEDPLSVRLAFDGVFERLTGELRATATAPHPIVLSAVIAVGLLVTGVWLLYAKTTRAKVLLAISAAVLMIGLPVANSRTGFVIVVLLTLPLLVLLVEKTPKILTWAVPLVFASAIAFAVSPGTPRLLLNSFTNPGADPNTTVRIERFSRIPELLEARPFLGAGYLTYDPQIQFFDNAYNLALIELGIIGLIVAVVFFIACLIRTWTGAVRAKGTEAVLPIAGVIGTLAILAGGLTFDAWTFDQFFPTCLILMGLGLGRSAVVLRRRNEDEILVHRPEMVDA